MAEPLTLRDYDSNRVRLKKAKLGRCRFLSAAWALHEHPGGLAISLVYEPTGRSIAVGLSQAQEEDARAALALEGRERTTAAHRWFEGANFWSNSVLGWTWNEFVRAFLDAGCEVVVTDDGVSIKLSD